MYRSLRKRQSGIKRAGPVRPSAYAFRVSQGGLSHIRRQTGLCPRVHSRINFSRRSYRIPSSESLQCYVASFSVQRHNDTLLPDLNFTDKSSLCFKFFIKLKHRCIIYLCYLCILVQMACSSACENVESLFESQRTVIARWIT